MKRLVPVIAVLLGSAPALSAQANGVAPGERVRVTSADGTRTTGRAVAMDGGAVGVRLSGADSAVAVGAGETVEVSRGRNRVLWTGVGALAGATVGVLVTRGQESEPADIGGLQKTADGVANTLTGVLIGGALGYFLAPERWRQVSPARVTVQQQAGGGMEIGIALRR